MMMFPRKEIVDRIKKDYPEGTRVELVSMDDPYSKIPEGTRGTVRCVDDTGTIFVNWDNGSGLGIVYGEDSCRKITECPICKKIYSGHPALSRKDNKTLICPDCGTREALESAGVPKDEQEEIIDTIHKGV